MKILVIGNPLEHHVGAHFLAGAGDLGWEAAIVDVRAAWSGNRWVNRFFNRVMGAYPVHLGSFSKQVVDISQEFKPELVLTTGVAPVADRALGELRAQGARVVNFLTDDPWNPRNGAGFFWRSLPEYDLIFTTRQANMDDLVSVGARRVEYLPFGYNPSLHFVEEESTAEDESRFACDVAILGGADDDRIPLARALAEAGYRLALYGGYWEDIADLKRFARGFVHGRELRLAARLATCQVCMVRRANRDGHAMRSLEFPAMGACLISEDTREHRELFGPDGEGTLYWSNEGDLVDAVGKIVRGEVSREDLAADLRRRVTSVQSNRYADRLNRMGELL